MTRDMNKILMRICTLALLLMVSMGTWADVKVLFGENGTEKYEGSGGTVEVKQEESKSDNTKVTVSLIVTPSSGYTLAEKNSLEVYAVISPDAASTRALEVSGDALDLTCSDFEDISLKRTYTVDIDSKLALWVKSVTFTQESKGNRSAGPVTITTAEELASRTGKVYLIQSYMNEAYYMRQNTSYVTTNSIVTTDMEWYFLDGGTDGGTQYYYIYNLAQSKYMYCVNGNSGTNAQLSASLPDSDSDKDKYRFKLVLNSAGTAYNIYVKNSTYPLVKSTGNWQAPGGNNNQDIKVFNITGTTPKDTEIGLWNFVAKANYDKTLPDGGFRESTSGGSHIYYFIQNNAYQSYYMIPGTPYVSTDLKTDTNSENMMWYFVKAASDDYLDYYYIINNTGKYLHYRGGTNQTFSNATELKDYVSGDEDNFQFIIVRGSRSVETHDNPNTTFCIVSKKAKTVRYDNIISLCRSSESAVVIDANKERNDSNPCHWNFIGANICKTPVISYYDENQIQITCETEGATIYYTTDGTDPTTSSSTYGSETKITITETMTTVKAYAVKAGMADSRITTFNLTVDDPVITYNAADNTVSLSCATPGATFYYTTDGTDPTPSSTLYIGGFSLGTASIVKAIAQKGGVVSNVVTQSFINGLYYIKHYNKDYRMYPTTNSSYVRTTTNKDIEAVWEIRPQGKYFTIMHYNDDKYMWTSDATINTNTVHLAVLDPVSLDAQSDENRNKLLYEFAPVASLSGVYTIRPINAANADDKNFLDTTQGDNGSNTIGLYNTGDGIRWEFVKIPTQPVISVNDIDVTISNALGDIKYTTDGSDPLISGTAVTYSDSHSVTVTLNYGPEYTVRAISQYTDKSSVTHTSEEAMTTVQVAVKSPVFSVSGNEVTISSPQFHQDKINIRYSYGQISDNVSDPDPSGNVGSIYESPITLDEDNAYTIKAIAYSTIDEVNKVYSLSSVRSFTVNSKNATPITSFAGITDQGGNYYIAHGFSTGDTPANNIGTPDKPFKGKIDGSFVEITLGNSPLFECVEDAVIKNFKIVSASVSNTEGDGHAGAIANVAKGETRIYNCGVLGGTVSGNGNVGSIVGRLEGFSRVINCYSFANVSGGSYAGGIVGYNAEASNSINIQTMVMNCMYYGNVSSGTHISPVYGGKKISNAGSTGLNNYNYYSYTNQTTPITDYNCALAAEDKYLNRFEFFRHTLNSTRDLAAWYATGSAANADTEMAKWVLEKSDKSITDPYPYPILKEPQNSYPSVVNYDAKNVTGVSELTQDNRNKGNKLKSMGSNGELTVKIQSGSGGDVFNNTSATITTGSKELIITDKDPDRFNFNFGKVQLPYYNEVGTGNYTNGRVVTGWKIVEINNSSSGTGDYSTGKDVEFDTDGKIKSMPYNFVDRKSTKKDLYGVSGRVFSQGAYWEVPDGVESITIEPYWAKAVFLADEYYDVTYDKDYTTETPVAAMGARSFKDPISGQTVYTDFTSALNYLAPNNGHKVYDYAVVLVGNYHKCFGEASLSGNVYKPLTVMSADLNKDNEPDFCFFYQHKSPQNVTPIRFDFITVPAIAMAMKADESSQYPQPGVFYPKGWFEMTNTSLMRFGQFEYGRSNVKTRNEPVILMGGIYEQFLSCRETDAGNTPYIHVGGNAWFKEFNNGCHTKASNKTPKNPISVSGGDYNKFYLSGIYRPEVVPATNDNAECYIDGGRFGEVAGAGMQKIDGSVTWVINAADITDFFGGGINPNKPITGDIKTFISNSWVTNFYGGPKFGEMSENKIVVSDATDCHFTMFYGAGYGGNAYNRVGKKDDTVDDAPVSTWNGYISSQYEKGYVKDDAKGIDGISTGCEYEYIINSNTTQKVARFYVNYASLSLATTHDVTSNLTGCRITSNFFGGGNLGYVTGNVTSTLTNCKVGGNVFGAGLTGQAPKIMVMRKTNFVVAPKYDNDAGVFNDDKVEFPASDEYTWKSVESVSSGSEFSTEDGVNFIHTTVNLDHLGTVSGLASLTLAGTTTVGGDVYGGGDASGVANTRVTLMGNTTVNGNVFGGGNEGIVEGSATVNIQE
mgnify:CR=1 FL=1